MKLTVKSGESIEKAIEYLQRFLKQYEGKNLMLKGNMNIYINLENFEHGAISENNAEFVLSGDETTDTDLGRKKAKSKELKMLWDKKMRSGYGIYDFVQQSGGAATKEHFKKELAEYELMRKLNFVLDCGNAHWYFEKRAGAETSPYEYTFIPYLVFDDVAGEAWYFAENEDVSDGKDLGLLLPGVPKGYQP